MATDRERAEARRLLDLWRTVSHPPVRMDQSPSDGCLTCSLAIALQNCARALAPTDAEREAMREVVELIQRYDLVSEDWDNGRGPRVRMAPLKWGAWVRREDVISALARLDAATGGRGDG